MAARNETSKRPSATLVYDMSINSHIVIVVPEAAKQMLAIWMEAEALAHTTGNIKYQKRK